MTKDELETLRDYVGTALETLGQVSYALGDAENTLSNVEEFLDGADEESDCLSPKVRKFIETVRNALNESPIEEKFYWGLIRDAYNKALKDLGLCEATEKRLRLP